MSDAVEYERLMAAFDELVELGPSERAERLENLRGEDPDMAAQLAKLLDADARAYAPLERVVDLSRVLELEEREAALASEETPERSPPAELGESIGLYRLTEIIGRGGMGCVYRAEHVHLPRVAAVKILEPRLIGDAHSVARFLREAKVVSAIRHPNIVDVFDFIDSEEPRRVAFVMELLKGSTLAETLTRGALSLEETLSACLQLCSALAAVHQRGVVHRDLKPENVMVVGPLAGGEEPSVKLLDFGIAKAPHPEAHQTATGVMMGTPRYMAPEQFAAEAPTSATDVYALAELAYEMLTGQPVFPGRGLRMMRRKMAGAADLALPGHIPHRDRLTHLLKECLHAEPAARPTVDRLAAELASLGDRECEPGQARSTNFGAGRASLARIAGGVGLALALLVGLEVVGTAPRGVRGPPKTPARGLAGVQSAQLPAVIYGETTNTPYVGTGFMGDSEALELDEAWPDNPRSGSTCLRVTYAGTRGWAGLAWLDPQDDWGDRPGGLAMTGASRLTWWARSDVEGLEIKVGYGLLLKDKEYYDSDRDEQVFFLTSDWTEYALDLRGKNLRRIKSPFYFVLEAPSSGRRSSFYFDDIQFE